MKTGIVTLALLLAATLAGPSAQAAPAAPAYSVVAKIPAPDGRWDFASWDTSHHVLLVTHGNEVLVIDPAHPASVRAVGSCKARTA